MLSLARFLLPLRDPLYQLAQARQCQQGRWLGTRRSRHASIIGPTHRHRAVQTIGQAHDQVGIGAATDAQYLNSLLIQRMMGMDDGDKSRTRLGLMGSVLRVFP